MHRGAAQCVVTVEILGNSALDVGLLNEAGKRAGGKFGLPPLVPAKAGTQGHQTDVQARALDSRLRGNERRNLLGPAEA